VLTQQVALSSSAPAPPLKSILKEHKRHNGLRDPPTSNQWQTHVLVVLLTSLSILLLYMVVPHALALLTAPHRTAVATTPPVLYPMAQVVPIEECIVLAAAEVRKRVFKLGETTTINLNDLRASMLFHMQQQNMSGMCAQFLMTQRVCYCIVNMARSDLAPPELVDMYNMAPLGYSVNKRMINTEKLPFCEKPYDAHRFNALFFEYLDSDGVVHERYASGTPAHVLQILDDVQRGWGYCIDTNLDALLVRAMRGITLMESAMHGANADKASDRRPLQLPRS
jgi:hypothetical protein